jgi:NADH-quinone oxidoreductase subunit A
MPRPPGGIVTPWASPKFPAFSRYYRPLLLQKKALRVLSVAIGFTSFDWDRNSTKKRGPMPPTTPYTSLTPPFFPWEPGALALLVFFVIVLVLLAVILFLSGFLVRRRPTPEKQRPYECGILPTGDARFRYPVPFFLLAVFFLLFDVETAYILSWAVAWPELGLVGYLRMAVFIVILGIGLAYAWRKGGLDWTEEEGL